MSDLIESDPRFAAAVEQAKLEALYQFAYGLSHEINNPLANIATRAQTLLIDERDPQRRRKLATINQQAFRAHEMIADLMLFARPPALKLTSVDVGALVEGVLGELQGQAKEQATSLEFQVPGEPCFIEADPTHLAVAIKALLQNALEAVKGGGSVVLEVGFAMVECESQTGLNAKSSVLRTQYSVPDTQYDPAPTGATQIPNPKPPIPNLRLTIRDTGPGIPPETRPHIFDPFFSGREAGRGLGLGLSKAWRIVQLHGGSIDVNSPPGGGATFTILLPKQAMHS